MPIRSDRIVKRDCTWTDRFGSGVSIGIQLRPRWCVDRNWIVVRLRGADDCLRAKAKMDLASLARCQRAGHLLGWLGNRHTSSGADWLAGFVKLALTPIPSPAGKGEIRMLVAKLGCVTSILLLNNCHFI